MSRLSVAGMMGVVLLAAMSAAALSAESEVWSSAIYSLALTTVGFAVVGAMLHRGPARAFWMGFALFGGMYAYLAFDGDIWTNGIGGLRRWASSDGTAPRPRLVTDVLLDTLYQYAARSTLPAVGDQVQVQWGNPRSYYTADVTKLDGSRVQILWSGYVKGQEEWVAASRVKTVGPLYFHATGHAILILVIALLGGVSARVAFGSREPSDRPDGSEGSALRTTPA
jgi:hypothetical protein